jgi:phosphate-selective porin
MTIARSLVCASVAAGLLAACSQSSNTASSSQAAAASAAPASGADTVISENDLPHPKGGEWAMSMMVNGAPAVTHNVCETGERINIKPSQQLSKNCSQFSIKRTLLGGLVVDMACTGPMNMAMTVHSEVKGDFNENYVSDTTSSVTMQGQPARSFTTHTEAHYVGPCTSGGTN